MGWFEAKNEMKKIEKVIKDLGGNPNKSFTTKETPSWDNANKALDKIGEIAKRR